MLQLRRHEHDLHAGTSPETQIPSVAKAAVKTVALTTGATRP